MASPFDISADEIDAWSRTKVAEGLLPKLVRRIVAASIRSGEVRFRADAGVRLGGFDGIVNAVDPAFFCPSGLSVWELSVSRNAREKADGDFHERVTKPVAGIPYGQATYVAVTGRRFPTRHEWEIEKRAQSIFANVLAYDADDLASALEQAPTVAIWFAEVIGRPIRDLSDPESFLARWSRETRPALPPELLLAGRHDEAQAVRDWLGRDNAAWLRVQAETREEAAAFIAAALSLDSEPDQLSRVAFVDSEDAWRSVLRRTGGESLLLVPTFEPAPLGEASENVRVAIPLGRNPGTDSAICISPLEPRDIAQALAVAGFEQAQAERFARDTRGSMRTLKRLCGVPHTLPWASGDVDATLLALLLVGSWEPGTRTDREAIEALGVNADETDARCTSLSKTADPPIERHGAAWRWTSPATAWEALAPHLSELLLAKFQQMAVDVLGRPATVGPFGVAVSHSPALRSGIATSLVQLVLHDEALKATFGTSRGGMLAEAVVRQVLKTDSQVWLSLGDVLSTLAEAAPERFLDAIDESLDAGEDGVAKLLKLERMSWYPHVRVLWALETLGWGPAFAPRVATAFARLSEQDPGGRVANRPARSLAALLHWAVPQTAAPLADRIATLKRLFRRYPAVARGVALTHFNALRLGILANAPAPRPRLRAWEMPAPGRQAPRADGYAQLAETLDLLLADADDDGERWAALVEPLFWLPHDLRERAFGTLEGRASAMKKRRAIVDAVRERLHWLHIATPFPELIPRLTNLLDALSPADEAEKNAWLFSHAPNLPEKTRDWEDEERRRGELRADALIRIWSCDDRWGLLRRLIVEVSAPELIAVTLARLPWAKDCEDTMRAEPAAQSAPWGPLLPTLISQRILTTGADVEKELRELVETGRMLLARDVARGLFAGRALWRALASVSPALAESYWLSAPVWLLAEREDVEIAVESLLAVARPTVAVQIASHAAGKIQPETALRVLDALREATGAEIEAFVRTGAATYHLERLFEVVDRAPDVPTERMVTLEVAFMTPLKETRRRVPHLSRALATNPEEFLALMRTLYRPEDEPKEGDAGVEQQPRAEGALRILWDWDGVPGEHLPEGEREAFLLQWCRRVLRALTSEGRAIPAICEVGKILARAPAATDGVWPCITARELIDGNEFPLLAKQLPFDKYNLRGVTTRGLGDGGEQERKIAANLRADAERLRVEFPRTAAMLVAMADDYGTEADEEDVRARVMLDEN